LFADILRKIDEVSHHINGCKDTDYFFLIEVFLDQDVAFFKDKMKKTDFADNL